MRKLKQNEACTNNLEEVQECVLELLKSGVLYTKKEVRQYLNERIQDGFTDITFSNVLHRLIGRKKIWAPQRGYYIREEENVTGRVFWILWECKSAMRNVLALVESEQIELKDIDIVREIRNIENMVDRFGEKIGR